MSPNRTTGKQSARRCDTCRDRACREDRDCFDLADQVLPSYSEDALRLAQVASRIEGRYYMQKTRLEEVMLFAHEMGYHKLGVAFCIGLAQEAEILCRLLRHEFKVVSVCCKVCAIQKQKLGLEEINPGEPETMCNPIGQATLLNQAKTDLNLICGLCIGHDIQFTTYSDAPVSTFIVKDRVLGHNPAAALWCRYVRKRIDPDEP